MKTYEEIKNEIERLIDIYKEELLILNNDLADHPEVSSCEFETSRKIVELLREKGYEVEYPYVDRATAFRAISGDNHHKYKIAILAEYDALPEIGHACGHCLSGSISILAGLSLQQLQDELNADIHIIGTPAEEIGGGKCAIANAGIFDMYDMAMMVHLYDENLIAPKLLAIDFCKYNFYGKSVHASNCPWEGINALNAAQLMFHAIDMLRQHVTPDVRMHGIIRNGGDAPNIVPEKTSAEFYIRALDRKYLNDLVQKVDDCARGAAIATQTTWDKCPTSLPYDNLLANQTGDDALREVFHELNIPLNGNPEVIFGSSDIGNVSFKCPTFHPCLQVVEKGIAIHTREFAAAMKTERAYQALVDGAKLIAFQIAKIFSDEEKIMKMKADFQNAVEKNDGNRT